MKYLNIRRMLLTTSAICSIAIYSPTAGASDIGDLTALKDAIASGGDYTLTDDITIDATTNIGKDISINGNGKVIDAGGKIGFTVSSGTEISLKDIKLTGGYRSNGGTTYGGALINGPVGAFGSGGHITELSGEFYGNKVYHSGDSIGDSRGSVLYNLGNIDELSGYFHDNESYSDAKTTFSQALGTNIYLRSGTIGHLGATAANNKTTAIARGSINALAYGGFLMNHSGTLRQADIEASNTTMSANAENGNAYVYGGNIYASGHLGSGIDDNIGYINSKIKDSALTSFSENGEAQVIAGGVFSRGTVYTDVNSTVENLTMTAKSNNSDASVYAGNFYYGGSYTMEGNFIGTTKNTNIYSTADNGTSEVVADIMNFGTINGSVSITSYNNEATATGKKAYLYGAVYNSKKIAEGLTANIHNNVYNAKTVDGLVEAYGIITNYGDIDGINADIHDNVYNLTASGSGTVEFDGVALFAGVSNSGTVTGKIVNNTVNATTTTGGIYSYGTLISNYGGEMELSNITVSGNTININTDSGTVDNHLATIYNTKNLTITADGGNSVFAGNKTTVNGEKRNMEMYSEATGIANLNAKNNGQIYFEGELTGEEGYKISLQGDGSGIYNFGSAVKNADIYVESANTIVGQSNLYDNNNALLMQDNGVFRINNAGAGDNYRFRRLELTGGSVEFNGVSVDLANETMGRITADGYASGSGKINVNSMILTSDANGDNASVLFADSAIAGNVENKTGGVVESTRFKYSVAYNDSTGKFEFVKTGVASDVTNTGSSAAATGSNQTTIDNEVLDRAEELVSKSMVHQGSELVIAGTTSGEAPILNLWVKPFGADEDIELKYGRVVDSKLFGLMAGVDTLPIAYGNGYSAIYTLYGVYSNALLKNDGYKTRQQGYALGARAIVYKDKFFAGMTVNGGIQKARSTTRFGIDHFDMYTGSAAFKVGYNIGFESDKYVVQPNMSTTYTYVKAEDYTAKSGLKIKSEGLNVVEFAPGLKLMYNHDNATQVYAKAAMIWDYIDGGDVKANDVALPEVSAKPYAEYGFGFEKSFTPSFVGFGEIVRHDGGREGWAGNFGLKYAF